MFNQMTEDIDVIGGPNGLPDRPLEGAGAISVAELKNKFDFAGSRLKSFINSLIEAMAASTAAGNIGATINGTSGTVQGAINVLAEKTDEAVSAVYSGTLTVAGWSGETGQFSQAVTINGILAADEPIIDLNTSSTLSTAVLEDEAWASIYRAVAANNTITFYAKEKPELALNFRARCIRK